MSNKLTMRRIDPSEAPRSETSSQDKSELRARTVENVQPVQSFGGTFVVATDEQIKSEEVQGPKGGVIPQHVVNNGVITAMAPTTQEPKMEENNTQEMEEVSYEDWAQSQKSDLSEGKLSASQLVTELVGKSVAAAKELLQGMKQKGQITDFRVAPIGTALSMDFQPGRVQVLSDHTGNVVDVEVS